MKQGSEKAAAWTDLNSHAERSDKKKKKSHEVAWKNVNIYIT